MSETVIQSKPTAKQRVIGALRSLGLPRLIIGGFLLLLFILAPFVNADLPMQRALRHAAHVLPVQQHAAGGDVVKAGEKLT